MGGLYYCFSVVLSQVSCWAAASLYAVYYHNDGKVSSLPMSIFIGGLQVLWLSTVVLFLRKIKPQYLSSFYSTTTARQLFVSFYRDHQKDEIKMRVFNYHSDLWSDVRDEVKAYSLSNWRRWSEEKPAWFNENFKAAVPDEFIPEIALEDMVKMQGGKRRKSSVGLLM